MRIDGVRIPARDLTILRPFYSQALGLPLVSDGADAFAVQIGPTRLTFARVDGADDPGAQHFAFTIPRNQLAAGKAWLAGRAALLTLGADDEFSAASWRAQQVYFRDPAGNILELIARQTLDNAATGPFDAAGRRHRQSRHRGRTLDNAATGPFDAGHLLNVSEVGLPTDDVPGAVAALGREFGLAVYGEVSDTFTAVGDAHGLLIVVQAGRHWFPTTTAAQDVPIAVTLAGAGGVVARGAWTVRGGR